MGYFYGTNNTELFPETIRNIGGILMAKWECSLCGYLYDPALGDPDGGIAPGTPFEDIPDDWVCPDCGASKDMFEKVD